MKIDVLNPSIVHLHTTTRCNLRCKYCGWQYPYFKTIEDQDPKLVIESLAVITEVFSHIHELRIEGGEALLYPFVKDIINSASKFKSSYDTLSIVTNGSYLPNSEILDCIANIDAPIFVRIDRYGDLSKCAYELERLLEKRGIMHDLRHYEEEDQFSGGWLDFGVLEDKGWSERELQHVFFKCECGISKGEYTIWDGKIFGCSRSPVAEKLIDFGVPETDFVNMFDGTSINEMREKVIALYKKPLKICTTCFGADRKTGVRIPAAEQLP